MSISSKRLLAPALLAALSGTAFAAVENPDHVIYGAVTIFDQPAPPGTIIEMRSARDGEVLASYALGRDTRLNGLFALRMAMDDAGDRLAAHSRPGDPVRAFVGGRLAAETTIGAQGTAVRLNLDPKAMGNVPTLDVPNLSRFEGASGSAPMTFVATLSATSQQAASFHWKTREDGGAIGGLDCAPGVDFVRDEGDVVIPAGQTQASFDVLACGDAQIEPDEIFRIDLSQVVNALSARSEVTGTVLDDDDQPALSVDSVLVSGDVLGSIAEFTVTLSRAAGSPVSVAFSTEDGTATAGADYVATNGVAVIAAGSLATTVPVTVLGDAIAEPRETFRLQLGAAQNAIVAQPTGVATIIDATYVPELANVDEEVGGPGGIAELLQPTSLALAPDGAHLYATSRAADALLHFTRNASSGGLTLVRSYASGDAGFQGARLDGARDMKLSPDGNHVYVVADSGDAITVFARSGAGVLSFVQAQVNGQPDTEAAATTIAGLDGAHALAVSPDGSHVYVLGRVNDSVAVFARDAATGRLRFLEAERNAIDDAADAGAAVAGLDEPNGLAISADGAQVYVAAKSASAVVVFARDAASGSASFGRLSYVTRHLDDQAGVDGIGGATSVALSGDGLQLYATGASDNAVAVFDRAANGTLAWRRMYRKGDGKIAGLGGAEAVRVAPDGTQVFVAGFTDHTVSVFERAGNGDLAIRQTLVDGVESNKLAGPSALEPSANDRHVYVAASLDNAIVVFQRLAADAIFRNGFE